MYSITQTFQNQTDLLKHIEMMIKSDKQEKKKMSQEPDLRGRHMSAIHEKAKTVKLANPEMSYKECMGSVGK